MREPDDEFGSLPDISLKRLGIRTASKQSREAHLRKALSSPVINVGVVAANDQTFPYAEQHQTDAWRALSAEPMQPNKPSIPPSLIPKQFHVVLESQSRPASDTYAAEYNAKTRIWHTTVFPSLVPSSRREAVLLERCLDNMITRIDDSKRSPREPISNDQLDSLLDRRAVLSICFHEVVRQVSTHCVERGHIMARLWGEMCELFDTTVHLNERHEREHQDQMHLLRDSYEEQMHQMKKESGSLESRYEEIRMRKTVMDRENGRLATELKASREDNTTLRVKLKELEAENRSLMASVLAANKMLQEMRVALRDAEKGVISRRRIISEAHSLRKVNEEDKDKGDQPTNSASKQFEVDDSKDVDLLLAEDENHMEQQRKQDAAAAAEALLEVLDRNDEDDIHSGVHDDQEASKIEIQDLEILNELRAKIASLETMLAEAQKSKADAEKNRDMEKDLRVQLSDALAVSAQAALDGSGDAFAKAIKDAQEKFQKVMGERDELQRRILMMETNMETSIADQLTPELANRLGNLEEQVFSLGKEKSMFEEENIKLLGILRTLEQQFRIAGLDGGAVINKVLAIAPKLPLKPWSNHEQSAPAAALSGRSTARSTGNALMSSRNPSQKALQLASRIRSFLSRCEGPDEDDVNNARGTLLQHVRSSGTSKDLKALQILQRRSDAAAELQMQLREAGLVGPSNELDSVLMAGTEPFDVNRLLGAEKASDSSVRSVIGSRDARAKDIDKLGVSVSTEANTFLNALRTRTESKHTQTELDRDDWSAPSTHRHGQSRRGDRDREKDLEEDLDSSTSETPRRTPSTGAANTGGSANSSLRVRRKKKGRKGSSPDGDGVSAGGSVAARFMKAYDSNSRKTPKVSSETGGWSGSGRVPRAADVTASLMQSAKVTWTAASSNPIDSKAVLSNSTGSEEEKDKDFGAKPGSAGSSRRRRRSEGRLALSSFFKKRRGSSPGGDSRKMSGVQQSKLRRESTTGDLIGKQKRLAELLPMVEEQESSPSIPEQGRRSSDDNEEEHLILGKEKESIHKIFNKLVADTASENRPNKPKLQLLKMISKMYDEKHTMDIMDDREKNRRHTLQEFCYIWTLNKYGLQRLAETHVRKLLANIRAYSSQSARIRMFGRLLHVLDGYPIDASEFFNFMLLVRINGQKWLSTMPEDEPSSISMLTAMEAMRVIFEANFPDVFNRLRQFLEDRSFGPVPETREVDLDVLMDQAMAEWLGINDAVVARLRSLFRAADVNGNGSLSYQELLVATRYMDPNMSVRKIQRMYKEAIMMSPVMRVDVESFVQVCRIFGMLGWNTDFASPNGVDAQTARLGTIEVLQKTWELSEGGIEKQVRELKNSVPPLSGGPKQLLALDERVEHFKNLLDGKTECHSAWQCYAMLLSELQYTSSSSPITVAATVANPAGPEPTTPYAASPAPNF